MSHSYKVLIMGASYGSLLGTKLLLAGHSVTLVCTSNTAELINNDGTVVRLPVRGRDGLVSIASFETAANLYALTPEKVDPAYYDLVVLGMQEPQYSSAGVRELLAKVALAKVPCMAIMNMPPLPFLRRIADLDVSALEPCYVEPGVWSGFDPELVTLASPDPQAFRPPEEAKNVLQVSLPTNFKVAAFSSSSHTAMLSTMQKGIESYRHDINGERIELPVKLKVHDSLFVPLAKWSMLITGNYRCILENEMISIKEAVHGDLQQSQACYAWVVDLCVRLGASTADMVPFEKYAKAASGLVKPSSGARALFDGAANIERVDMLVQKIAKQHGMSLPTLDKTVEFVDKRLQQNRVQ